MRDMLRVNYTKLSSGECLSKTLDTKPEWTFVECLVELNESAASKNKKRTRKHDSVATWCLARNIDNKMECFTPKFWMRFWQNSLLKSGKNMGKSTNQIHFALCSHYSTGISAEEKLFGIYHQRASSISLKRLLLPRQNVWDKAKENGPTELSRTLK